MITLKDDLGLVLPVNEMVARPYGSIICGVFSKTSDIDLSLQIKLQIDGLKLKGKLSTINKIKVCLIPFNSLLIFVGYIQSLVIL